MRNSKMMRMYVMLLIMNLGDLEVCVFCCHWPVQCDGSKSEWVHVCVEMFFLLSKSMYKFSYVNCWMLKHSLIYWYVRKH